MANPALMPHGVPYIYKSAPPRPGLSCDHCGGAVGAVSYDVADGYALADTRACASALLERRRTTGTGVSGHGTFRARIVQ